MRNSIAVAVSLGALSTAPVAAHQTPSVQSSRPWTLLVYGAADNNADGPILHFLDQVRTALDGDPGMELLLLLDRHAEFSDDATFCGEDFSGTRLYRVKRDSLERLSGDEELPEIGLTGDVELDTADPDTLRRFVRWGKKYFPAQRTGLLVYSHANGETMCPDETDERDMGIAELSDVLGVEESVDFLALELCNMGGIEIAYQWRPRVSEGFGADVLVAIPNAGPPLDWDRAFARIRSPGHASAADEPHFDPATLTAQDFGKLVIEEGQRGRELAAGEHPEDAAHEAAACYDLGAVEPVKRAVDALAVELARSPDARHPFMELRGPGPGPKAMNYQQGGPYVDLYDLCRLTAESDAFEESVRKAARDVLAAVDRFVVASFGMSSYAGFQPGANGVFIVLPANEPDRWRMFTWYTPLAGPGPQAYGRWSFLGDGATQGNGKVETWFELLDSWFDEANDKGGINGYRW